MTLGILLYSVGFIFRIQHWPDMFKGMISGPVALIIGVVLFIVSLKIKNKRNKK
jgi:hypothetical protein